jgi:drug/metabolite transporter (DMT)-like permease
MTLPSRRPEIALVAVTVVWGSTFVVTKGVLREAPPMLYLSLRFGIAAAVLFALFPRAARAPRALLISGLVLGGLQAVGVAVQVFAQVYTTASKAAFVTALSTALTPLLSLALYRDRPRTQQLVGVALATVGLAALTWPGARADWNRGDLMSLGCAFIYAWVIVETARRSRGQDIATLATLQSGVAAVVLVVVLAASHGALAVLPADHLPELLRLEARGFAPTFAFAARVLYMAVVCTVFTFLAQTWAMSRISATQSAVVFALEPLFATGLAVAVEGAAEWPGPRGAVGAAFIVAGLIVAEAQLPGRAADDR